MNKPKNLQFLNFLTKWNLTTFLLGQQMSLLEELKQLEMLRMFQDPLVKTIVLDNIALHGKELPILGFSIGSQDPKAPSLGLFGGVHGLERIGTHIVINYLKSLFKQLTWDQDLRQLLQNSRICSIPLINPGGMHMFRRSNPNGVDLMRNSPVDTDPKTHTPLVSGHRISNKLPWYRGSVGQAMEKESLALIDFVKTEMFKSTSSLSVDFHSGFGLSDRLWYPFAYAANCFPLEQEAQKLKELLTETMPYHVYTVEPQTASYTIAGDLWDHIFLLHQSENQNTNNKFIPWTVELGSWMWVKKNPIQMFSREGFFNPIKQHRYSRIMRRHAMLIDFFFKAVRNGNAWQKFVVPPMQLAAAARFG